MKFALVATLIVVASAASARTVEPSFERGPDILPPLAITSGGILNVANVAREPLFEDQSRFRNTMNPTGLPTTQVATSNALRPRGGGAALLYFY